MKLNIEQLQELNQLAEKAAKEAALLIAEHAHKEVKTELKAGVESLASQVVTEVDRRSQDTILKILQPSIQKYDLGLLAEESEDNQSRLSKDYFWCIDPMDGTLAFTRKKAGYSVSIALVSREGIAQISTIANPVDQSIYTAVKGAGAYKNGKRMALSDFRKSNHTFTLACDPGFLEFEKYETTFQAFKKKIAEWGYLNLNILDTAGAVMNAIWVLENAPACYFKFRKQSPGGGSIWDFAASACLYNELGALVSDIDGNPLKLNMPESSYMNSQGAIYCTEPAVQAFITDLYREMFL